MSKQRCLLIALVVFAFGLMAEVHIESTIFGVRTDAADYLYNQSIIDGTWKLGSLAELGMHATLDAADGYLGDSPQKKQGDAMFTASFGNEVIRANAAYRGTLYGSSQELTLYPDWKGDGYYSRASQHTSYFSLNGAIGSFTPLAYVSHKHLRAIPTEYVYDIDTDTMIATDLPERGFDDLYYGVNLNYGLFNLLSFSAFADLKQANFDAGDVYSLNSVGGAANIDYRLTPSSRIAGGLQVTNRDADNLPDEASNLYQFSLRYQQKLGLGLNGFVSFTNNGCSDNDYRKFYFLSNQLKCHLQYHLGYDTSLNSYLMVGAKYSPENEADAIFAEGKAMVLPRLYGFAAFKHNTDSYNQFQGVISYNLNRLSEVFVKYQTSNISIMADTREYIGLGTSIYF